MVVKGKILLYFGNSIVTLSGWNLETEMLLEKKYAYWDDFEEEVLEPFCEELGGTIDDFELETIGG